MFQAKLKNKQNGTAVFMALLVVTFVMAIIVIWFMQLRMATKQSQQILLSNQMFLYAQGVVSWAKDTLQNMPSTDIKKILPFPVFLQETRIGVTNGTMSGRIDDEQAKLNLNNMADTITKEAFIRLVSLVDSSVTRKQAINMADAIIAWITPLNVLSSPLKKINSQYSEMPRPYHAANQSMQSVSELRAVSGMSPALYIRLTPYLTTLPPGTPMNFKFALPIILRAFNIREPPLTSPISEYYSVRATVQSSNQSLELYTLINRSINENKIMLGIVLQCQIFNKTL